MHNSELSGLCNATLSKSTTLKCRNLHQVFGERRVEVMIAGAQAQLVSYWAHNKTRPI